MNDSDKGEVAELESQAAFKRSGYTVLTPIGHEQKYDFVAEKNNEFTRVQSKSGRIQDGHIDVHVCTYHSSSEPTTYTKEDIDVFSIYVPEIDEVYIVSVEEAPSKNMRIRLDETGEITRGRKAEDHIWSEQI